MSNRSNSIPGKQTYLYYDANISNIVNYNGGTYADKTATYDQPGYVLDEQGKYEVAVDFFRLQAEIPIFIMEIQEGATQTDPNKTIYGIALSYGGNDYEQNVVYVPNANLMNPASPYWTSPPLPPSANGGLQVLNSQYYYVYYLQAFLEMVNTAFAAAHADYLADNPTSNCTEPPQLIYNRDTYRIGVLLQYAYLSDPLAPNIYLNYPLQNKLINIPVGLNSNSISTYKNFRLYVTNDNNDNAYALKGATIPDPASSTPDYLLIQQESVNLSNFCNISSILFLSDSIALNPETSNFPINPNSSSTEGANFSPPTQQLLAYYDIIPGDNGRDFDWTSGLYYLPSYRQWKTMTQSGSLEKVRIQIQLLLRNGNVTPLFIPSGNDCDIKLVFRKKTST